VDQPGYTKPDARYLEQRARKRHARKRLMLSPEEEFELAQREQLKQGAAV